MSTRATYQLGNITIYIHHDGYEEGAAFYLYRGFMASPLDCGHLTAENFIRGNDRAEITDSHEAHGDTEYQYTISGEILTVKHRSWARDEGNWSTIYQGSLVAFINKHLSAHWFDSAPEKLFVVSQEYGGSVIYTASRAAKVLEKELSLKALWETNGNGSGANMNSLKERIRELEQAIRVSNTVNSHGCNALGQ